MEFLLFFLFNVAMALKTHTLALLGVLQSVVLTHGCPTHTAAATRHVWEPGKKHQSNNGNVSPKVTDDAGIHFPLGVGRSAPRRQSK